VCVTRGLPAAGGGGWDWRKIGPAIGRAPHEGDSDGRHWWRPVERLLRTEAMCVRGFACKVVNANTSVAGPPGRNGPVRPRSASKGRRPLRHSGELIFHPSRLSARCVSMRFQTKTTGSGFFFTDPGFFYDYFCPVIFQRQRQRQRQRLYGTNGKRPHVGRCRCRVATALKISEDGGRVGIRRACARKPA
jgi:hypothetical protein